MINDTYKLLASVTVVRELYDAGCSVYDVLEEFINEIIVRYRMRSFYVSELTEYLNKEYSFKLSDAVVKPCLKKMGLTRRNGKYICNDLDKRASKVNKYIGESKNRNEYLFSKLLDFMNKRLNKDFNETGITYIKNSFCDFLIQDGIRESGLYTQHFHEFILSIQNDTSMMETINEVKEGILLYEGIRYSSNISDVGTWNSHLNLVLDTEVLFAVGGYNSSLYQTMFAELKEYLNEINRGCPSNAHRVKLSYFSETKNEIDAYFESAERIVRGLDYLDPTKEAMGQIVNNCKYASEVQTKRTLFYQTLREQGIFVIDRDFYDGGDVNNEKYNLEDEAIIEKYSALYKESKDNIHRSLKCLSHINILRKGSSNSGFERCGYIFLTATGRTLKLASCSELLNEGNVPLATTFDFLINRFWFKLNKGFGSNKTPRTMDMVMRARHLLSSIVTSKVSTIYDELKSKYEKAEISKEEFYKLNSDLRSHLKTPEEIKTDTIGSDIDNLEKWNMEEIIEQQKKKDIELKNAQGTISLLQEQLNSSEHKYSELNTELQKVKDELTLEKNKSETETNELKEKLRLEREKSIANSKDIEELRKLYEDEKKKKEERDYNRKLWGYRVLRFLCALLLGGGIIAFVYGYTKQYKWAIAASAVLTASGFIAACIAFIKRLKPDSNIATSKEQKKDDR